MSQYVGTFYPKAILALKIPHAQKLILGFIAGFKGNCFASDAYIAENLGMSEKTVANNLSALRKRGLLEGRNFPKQGTDFPIQGTQLPDSGNRYVRIEKEIVNKSPPTSEDLIDWACEQLQSALIDNGFRASTVSFVMSRLEDGDWQQPNGKGGFDNREHLLGYAAALAAKMEASLK